MPQISLNSDELIVPSKHLGGHVIIPRGSQWRYLITDIEPLGWTNISYDDSGWSLGNAPFGQPEGACPLANDIRTVWDGSKTLYLRIHFILPDPITVTNGDCFMDMSANGNDLYINESIGFVGPFGNNTCPIIGNVHFLGGFGADYVEGDNLLVLRVTKPNISDTPYFDFELLGDVPWILSDELIVPSKQFSILSDELIVPPGAIVLTSDELIVVPQFTGITSLTSDELIVDSKAHGPGVKPGPPHQQEDCRTCLEVDCDETALEDWYNLDGPIFNYQLICPPGFACDNTSIFLFCCDRLLTATIPPTATDQQRKEIIESFLKECARLEAGCADPNCVPGTPNCPPIIPPPGGPPWGWYFNQPQQCVVQCSQGGSFRFTVPAGHFLSTSLTAANAQAHAFACRQARAHQICLLPQTLEWCIHQGKSILIQASGATARFPETNFWEVSGSLPTGLIAEEGVTTSSFMAISGLPTIVGEYPITVRITVNPRGDTQERDYTLKVKDCVTDYGNITPPIVSPGDTAYWNSGNDIPAGTYKVTYIEGAMGYGYPGLWYVNADFTDPTQGHPGSGFHINYGTHQVFFPTANIPDRIIGGIHYGAALDSQAEIEAAYANKFILINHTGGKIGMHLYDQPYGDNIEGSPNPTFSLQKM